MYGKRWLQISSLRKKSPSAKFLNDKTVMFSWFSNLSSYYLRLEQMAMLSAGLLFVAWQSFSLPIPFALKAALFMLYSAALLYGGATMHLLGWLRQRLFGPIKPNARERKLLMQLRQRKLPLGEEKVMLAYLIQAGSIRSGLFPDVLSEVRETDRHFAHNVAGLFPGTLFDEPATRGGHKPPLTGLAMKLLVWFFLFEMLITLGGARWLAQFPVVQEIAGLIPSKIFLQHGTQRTEYTILVLKIFKIVDVFALPFKVWAVYVMAAPFWKIPDIFPISPKVIWLDRESDVFQKIIKSFWPSLVFFVLLFVIVACVFVGIFDGYASDPSAGKSGNLFDRNASLNLQIWFWLNFLAIAIGVAFSCFVRMILDGFYLVFHLIKKGEGYYE